MASRRGAPGRRHGHRASFSVVMTLMCYTIIKALNGELRRLP
ncbi:hypothetical protein [Halomonas smyrnensis]|nr:hypothetical protein [Halomonas smyrnensis]